MKSVPYEIKAGKDAMFLCPFIFICFQLVPLPC